jgi:hypothetical protein
MRIVFWLGRLVKSVELLADCLEILLQQFLGSDMSAHLESTVDIVVKCSDGRRVEARALANRLAAIQNVRPPSSLGILLLNSCYSGLNFYE